MIAFWVAAALLAAGAGALILYRAALSGVRADAGDPSLAVYRRALSEIDELHERGLLPAEERRAARAEAGRRLLIAADRSEPPITADSRGFAPLLAAAAVATVSLVIYLSIGSPGLPDQPFSSRLAAWRANPERASPQALAAALADVANQRPGDPEPLRRLAAFDLSLGDADGAAHALRRAMVVAPAAADLPAMLGEVMVLKAQGDVGADARALFQSALKADPAQPTARYYLARAQIAKGDTAGGLAEWRAVLASLSPSDPRRSMLTAEIATVQTSGRLAPAAEGAATPSADMSAAITGMVEGLATRLQAHPDDPAGWVRLVRAYAVLGDAGKRDRALNQARARFAGRSDVLAALGEAARASPMNQKAR
jgi:cytochrome c-type biogenesis protein CcmH